MLFFQLFLQKPSKMSLYKQKFSSYLKKTNFIILLCFLSFSCGSKQIKPKKHESGINNYENSYFTAKGTVPFDWSLEISELSIRLNSDDGAFERNTPHIEPIRALDFNVKKYIIDTESGLLSIDIYHTDCSNTKNENKVTYVVKIFVSDGKNNTQEFEGCGEYIVDYLLHDTWVLESIQSREVTPEMFLGDLPMLEIRAKQKDFSGFGGCNKIRGRVFQEREILRFTDISSSEMQCDSKNKEGFFLNSLQSGTGYEIKNNRLYIQNPTGLNLVFKKID